MFEQSEMFPDVIPDIVMRVWKAVLGWYATGTHNEPTVQQIVNRMVDPSVGDPTLPASVETIRRARKTFPDLLPWPIKRGQLPPWRTKPELLEKLIDATPLELKAPDVLHLQTLEGVTVEVSMGADGVYRIVRWMGGIAGAVAAACAAMLVLDGMDGHLDHVIHWCLLLAKAIPYRA